MALASVPAASDVIDCAAISVDETTLFQTDAASQGLAKPTQSFLRWAGGKRWLLYHLRTILGGFEINGYHEPFLGGGAVFFGSMIKGPIHLSDLNADLIETYVQVRDNYKRVADYLETHVNTSEHYYETRASNPDDPTIRAAKFIYLNHTSYNGIYRVNLKGEYNVPFGNRANAHIPSRELLAAVSQKLQGAVIGVQDFQEVVAQVQARDLVILDPPYTVAHNNNGFIKYNQRLFSLEDQTRLSKVVDAVRDRGAYYLLTNAAHESITALFEKGDQKIELTRRNSIGGKQAKRGSAAEYLFTNVPTYG